MFPDSTSCKQLLVSTEIASQSTKLTYSLESVVHGHHIHERTWTQLMGKESKYKRITAVTQEPWLLLETVLLLSTCHRRLPELCGSFLNTESRGSGRCEITERRKKGNDLEVVCVYNLCS